MGMLHSRQANRSKLRLLDVVHPLPLPTTGGAPLRATGIQPSHDIMRIKAFTHAESGEAYGLQGKWYDA